MAPINLVPINMVWCTLNKRILIISFVWDANMAAVSTVFCVSWDCMKTKNTHGTNTHGPNTHGSITHGTNTHSTNTHSTNTHGTNTHGTNTHSTNTHSTNIHGTNNKIEKKRFLQ